MSGLWKESVYYNKPELVDQAKVILKKDDFWLFCITIKSLVQILSILKLKRKFFNVLTT